MTLQILILVIVSIQFLMVLAIAGSLARLIKYLSDRDSEPVVGSREENQQRGLQKLQDERDDRWGMHMTYDMPNYDGMSPKPKNFDGVGDGILTEADTEGRIE